MVARYIYYFVNLDWKSCKIMHAWIHISRDPETDDTILHIAPALSTPYMQTCILYAMMPHICSYIG